MIGTPITSDVLLSHFIFVRVESLRRTVQTVVLSTFDKLRRTHGAPTNSISTSSNIFSCQTWIDTCSCFWICISISMGKIGWKAVGTVIWFSFGGELRSAAFPFDGRAVGLGSSNTACRQQTAAVVVFFPPHQHSELMMHWWCVHGILYRYILVYIVHSMRHSFHGLIVAPKTLGWKPFLPDVLCTPEYIW